jgi:thiamine biosynthesis lipoprotein
MKRLFALGAVVMLLLTGCRQSAPEKRTAVGFYFDTVVTLTAYTHDEKLLKQALDECARYESLLSRTVAGSDIWRINQGGEVAVSADTVKLLRDALRVSEASGGAFDPTIEPATSLWDFSGENLSLPDPSALERAVRQVDYKRLVVEEGRVTLPEGMGLDLGGVAKGYIADRLAEFLRARGVEAALINLGGNVLALGVRASDRKPWVVGIQDPAGETGQYRLTVSAENLSVVTSGNYERFFMLDGVRYHHLLDPETGWPVQNGLDSVTVLSGSSALGDALSTACYVLGEEKARQLIEGFDGVEAIFIASDGRVTATDGASALCSEVT